MNKILIIDDDVIIAEHLSAILKKHGYKTQKTYTGNQALEIIKEGSFDLVFCDFQLSDMNGNEVLQNIKKVEPDIPVIIFTGYADVKTAVNVMKMGAFDYLIKPMVSEEVIMVVNRALGKNNNSSSPDPGKVQPDPEEKTVNISPDSNYDQKLIIGKSQQSQHIQKQMELVANTNYTVIVYGESGTGKESIASGIHQFSSRREHPFIAVDCGVLIKELSGSELFGHEKGAFTGAHAAKPGYFELANGGTIFLDEIANLSYDIQTSLLRVIQERKIRRIGSRKETSIDVRIIVASNKKLADLVETGQFREDLYHRLNEFSIYLHPLRERKEDFVLFATHFLKLVNQELDKEITAISEEALDILMQHHWPGNLRELNNVIRRAALLTEKKIITPESLPQELLNNSKVFPDDPTNNQFGKIRIPALDEKEDLKAASDQAKMYKIKKTLQKTNNNKSKAAKILGVDRKTLYNKLNEYGIKY